MCQPGKIGCRPAIFYAIISIFPNFSKNCPLLTRMTSYVMLILTRNFKAYFYFPLTKENNDYESNPDNRPLPS